MAEPVTGTFETKQIHELNPLAKLTGKEELLIDDGNGTLDRVLYYAGIYTRSN